MDANPGFLTGEAYHSGVGLAAVSLGPPLVPEYPEILGEEGGSNVEIRKQYSQIKEEILYHMTHEYRQSMSPFLQAFNAATGSNEHRKYKIAMDILAERRKTSKLEGPGFGPKGSCNC